MPLSGSPLIRYKSRWIEIVEAWFGEDPQSQDLRGVDLVEYLQRPEPIEGRPFVRFETLIIDLSLDEEELLNRMSKDTRYEIRRAAERDRVVHDYWSDPTPERVSEFLRFFREFARFKGLEDPAGSRFSTMCSGGRIHLSRVSAPDGRDLSWHAYIVGSSRTRLLYSASARGAEKDPAARSLIGRANRYQHFRDMLRFKESGYLQYDLGGWYGGDSDHEKLNINRFKEEFGGVHEQSYFCARPLTLKGWSYLQARRVRERIGKQ